MYFGFFYVEPQCFDFKQNGSERGVDCGGVCARICSFDVREPVTLWSRAFQIAQNQYNAVAYVENRNPTEGTKALSYTFKLYDAEGLIVEKSGVSTLPPNGTYAFFVGRIDTSGRTPTYTEFSFDQKNAVWLQGDAQKDRFSILKRQFKNTDAKPILTATIANNSLEDADDVEIVATVFNSKKEALTTSRTYVDHFKGRTTEDVVFTWPEAIAKTIRSCEVPTDVMVAIDLSGSMNDDGTNPPEPVSSVKLAAEAFVERLKNDDRVGLVTYATQANLDHELTTDKGSVSRQIRALSISPKEESGSTNIGDAIWNAISEFRSDRHNEDARKVLVILSDGKANAPGNDPEKYALEASGELKALGAEVYAIGLGNKVNTTFMKSLASNDAGYLEAPDSRAVDQIYKKVTTAICEDGVAVIDILPKSPSVFAPKD